MTSGDPIDPAARRQELFIADLLFGLTAEERAEYEALAGTASEDELQSLADVIGALDQTRAGADGARLPAALRERIRSAAGAARPRPVEPAPPARRSVRFRAALPWAVAVVCIVLTIVTLAVNGPFRRPETVQDPARMRERLLASAADVVRIDWSAGPTPVAGAGGDVAWSTGEQRGYMRFHGLPANDPGVEQYQLWIFDRNQDEKTPVDGGVFDVPAGGEVVVPIRPALRVREPYLFVITVEKPGGVVVSDRRRLPLLASVAP